MKDCGGGEEGDKALIDYVCTTVSVSLDDTRGYSSHYGRFSSLVDVVLHQELKIIIESL